MTNSGSRPSVLGATAAVWAGQAGAQLATAGLFAVLARHADPAGFGRTAVGYGLVLVAAQLVDAGAQQRLLRDAARAEPTGAELRALVRAKVALALALAPVLGAALLHFTGSVTAAVAGVAYPALRGITLLALALWPVRGEPLRAAGVTLLERVVAAAVGWALVATGTGAPAAVTLGLLTGAVATLLPATLSFRPAPGPDRPAPTGRGPRHRTADHAGSRITPRDRGTAGDSGLRSAIPAPGPRSTDATGTSSPGPAGSPAGAAGAGGGRHRVGRVGVGAGIAYGKHYAAVGIAGTLVLLDTVLVGAVAGDVEAGHYGMGARLLGPLVVLTAALCTALVPAVARGAGVRRAFLVVTALTLSLIAVVVAAAPLLVRLAAGPGYAGAVPAIRVYALVAGLAAVAQPVVAWLQARGDERWVALVLPAGIVAGLTGTGVGAALGGAVGGAAGQVAVSAGLCVLLAARFRSVRAGARTHRRRRRARVGAVRRA